MVAALLRGIRHVELLVAGGEALDADAEDLLLHGVDHVRRFEGVDLVERIAQALTHAEAICRVVLQAIGIQKLLSTMSSSSSPMRSAILRHAMQWRIQKSRTSLSGEETVRPSLTMGWLNSVGLKSMP